MTEKKKRKGGVTHAVEKRNRVREGREGGRGEGKMGGSKVSEV